MTSIVLDTSALIAILQAEPEADALLSSLEDADLRCISAASVVEAVSMTPHHADLARQAFRRFGRGRHPADLNFGDCFAYALALSLDAPLLFTGGGFARTDVRVGRTCG
jgi:ribonuclease VapC